MSPPQPTRPPGKKRRGCLLTLGVLLLLAAAAFFARHSLLPALARWWIIDESPATADAILVPGGNPSTRAAAAARLYHAGHAPLVLLVAPELNEVQKLGVLPPESEVTRSFLLKSGVPESAIHLLPGEVTSTRDEAMVLKAWCDSRRPARILVPTDLFHSRRVNWFMESTLEGTGTGAGTDIRVLAIDHPKYTADTWWKSEQGLIDFQNEVVKYLFYKLNY